MVTAVVAIHVLVSILLIFLVLIQGGENVDITAAFGGVSQAAFGPRGAVTTMQKITWALASIFVATSLTLAIWATKRGTGSVLETAPKSAPKTPAAPATPSVTPTAPAKK